MLRTPATLRTPRGRAAAHLRREFVVYRACDAFFSCDSVERWLRARDALSAETSSLRLGVFGDEEPACAFKNKCSDEKGQANHRRWPKQNEDEILHFFGRHTLAVDVGANEADAGSDASAP